MPLEGSHPVLVLLQSGRSSQATSSGLLQGLSAPLQAPVGLLQPARQIVHLALHVPGTLARAHGLLLHRQEALGPVQETLRVLQDLSRLLHGLQDVFGSRLGIDAPLARQGGGFLRLRHPGLGALDLRCRLFQELLHARQLHLPPPLCFLPLLQLLGDALLNLRDGVLHLVVNAVPQCSHGLEVRGSCFVQIGLETLQIVGCCIAQLLEHLTHVVRGLLLLSLLLLAPPSGLCLPAGLLPLLLFLTLPTPPRFLPLPPLLLLTAALLLLALVPEIPLPVPWVPARGTDADPQLLVHLAVPGHLPVGGWRHGVLAAQVTGIVGPDLVPADLRAEPPAVEGRPVAFVPVVDQDRHTSLRPLLLVNWLPMVGLLGVVQALDDVRHRLVAAT
mmetsp:Transcript_98830/g.235607  ORF Transcript_98830/g.235607 Transcript_98830/m.235607 type:complete len:388 (+) Transcript_98830:1338-2501(+)